VFKNWDSKKPPLFCHLPEVTLIEEAPNQISQRCLFHQDTHLNLALSPKNGDTVGHIEVSLSLLLPELETTDLFPNILLVNPEGDVKYQKDQSGILLASLDPLSLLPEPPGIFDFFSTESTPPKDKASIKPFYQEALSTPIQGTISLGGTLYKVFAQPVYIPSRIQEYSGLEQKITNGEKTWVICGLVPLSTWNKQYLKIPLTYLVVVVFVLLSLILSLPLARLVLMDPRQRLTSFNIFSLAMASVVGAGALTIGFLDWLAYSKTKETINRQLQASAEDIHSGFQAELNDILQQLDNYSRTEALESDINKIKNRLVSLPSKKQSPERNWIARTNVPCQVPSRDEEVNPRCLCDQFLLAFWIDPQGQFRLNWTQKNLPYYMGTLDLNHRRYVRHVMDADKPLFTKHFDNKDWTFYIDPIIALDTAEKSVVVSMLSPYPKEDDERWVAAMEQKLSSLMAHSMVPPGGGFAIIRNHDGKVVFHSDATRSLRENFYQEIEMDSRIRALVYAKSAGFVAADYWGKTHQFFVRPVDHLPWTLMVFREKEDIREFNFGMLLFGESLFTVYLLFIAIVACVVLGAIPRLVARGNIPYHFSFAWLWPHPENLRRYQNNVTVNMVLLFLGLVIFWLMNNRFDLTAMQAFVFACTLPIVGLVFLFIFSWVSLGEHPASNRFSLQGYSTVFFWFTLLGISWLLIFSAFPASVIFGIAQKEEMKLWAKRGLLHVKQNVEYTSPFPIRFSPSNGASGETAVIVSQFDQWLQGGNRCIPNMYKGLSQEGSDTSAQFHIGVKYPNILYPTKICFSPYTPVPDSQEPYVPIGGGGR